MDSDNENQNIEIEDVEGYRHELESFSHQQLVMKCMNKCIEAGCVEMVEGRLNNKKDKFGNTISVYVPDTRRIYIESVKTLKNIMSCDFDDEAIENINKLIKKLILKKRYWINEEHKWFDSLPYNQKGQLILKYGGVMEKSFNLNFFYHNIYISNAIDIYRRIFEELNDLTKRLDFYSSEGVEN